MSTPNIYVSRHLPVVLISAFEHSFFPEKFLVLVRFCSIHCRDKIMYRVRWHTPLR